MGSHPEAQPTESWETDEIWNSLDALYTENNMQFPEWMFQKLTDFMRSKVTQAQSERDEWLRKEIEKKCGKSGTQSGSFGYQGILMGIQSFQTEGDKMRDEILALLKPIK